MNKTNLGGVSTKQLFEELRTREGVKEIVAYPYVKYNIHVDADGDDAAVDIEDTGCASILIVID